MLLIRHAQSEWNLHFGRSRIDAGIPDPALTAEGVRQAESLSEELRQSDIRQLVCSPYRRALQTASIIARALSLPLSVNAMVRERCAFSCDQGSPPERLAAEWPELDFSALGEVWWGGFIESHESLGRRCARFRAWAASLPDHNSVAVVSHWGFIRGLTGQPLGNIGIVRFDPGDAAATGEELHR